MSLGQDAKQRLETWKEVANFFGKDERTVKRWESERGLPIHRLPGDARSRIFAFAAELESWRASRAGLSSSAATEVDQPGVSGPAAEPPPTARPRSAARRSAGLTLAIVGILASAVFYFITSTKAGQSRPPPLEAQRYLIAATDDWTRRTPESLNRSVLEYNQAIEKDPDYAEAYAGLAGVYDVLREYTNMPAAQAYPLARNAARRALRLNDNLASAHAALAFAEYWGFWNPKEAFRQFDKALAIDPNSAMTHHWYATALSGAGRQREALDQIDAALRLDPTSKAIAADRGLILFLAGRESEAVATLRSLETADPDFLSSHTYLADIDLLQGDYRGYLDEARWRGQLTGDQNALTNVAFEARALAGGGAAGFSTRLGATGTAGLSERPALSLCDGHDLRGGGRPARGSLVPTPVARPSRAGPDGGSGRREPEADPHHPRLLPTRSRHETPGPEQLTSSARAPSLRRRESQRRPQTSLRGSPEVSSPP